MSGDLTEHFSRSELACRCCGRLEFTQAAIEELEATRVELGWPMKINSGYRCPEHNATESSTGLTGPHTISTNDNVTIDVAVYGSRAWHLVFVLLRRGWAGIGIKQKGPRAGRFVHADRLPEGNAAPRPWVWSY